MSTPCVSVIMPLYNAGQYVREAIEGILSQTFRDFELLVVDDGSTDGGPDLVRQTKDARVRWLQNEQNLGPAVSRNRGLDAARGKFIAFFDSDDLARPERFATQLHFLDREPGVMIVGSRVNVLGAGEAGAGAPWGYEGPGDRIPAALLFRNGLATSTLLMRAKAIGTQRFRSDFPVASDYEMWTRLLATNSAHNLPTPLVQYRVHPANLTHRKQTLAEECLRNIAALQLSGMGLNPSPEEMSLHRQIANRPECSRAFVEQAEAWLVRLCEANRVTRHFAERPLDAVLAGYWREVCWNAAGLGTWIWRRYHRSPLRQRVEVEARDKYGFGYRVVRGALKQALSTFGRGRCGSSR